MFCSMFLLLNSATSGKLAYLNSGYVVATTTRNLAGNISSIDIHKSAVCVIQNYTGMETTVLLRKLSCHANQFNSFILTLKCRYKHVY